MSLKLHRWLALFLTVSLPLYANATSITVILSPDKIVVAADGKTSQYDGGKQVPASGRVAPKFRLFNGRTVVFTFGLAKIGSEPHPAFFVGDIFSSLKKQIREKSTPVEVADIVATQLREEFNGINEALAARAITREMKIAQTGTDNPLAGFGVVGYEKGHPMLYLIKIDIDWNANTAIPPKPTLLYPDPRNPAMNIFSSESQTNDRGEWAKCRVSERLPASEKMEETARSIVDLGIETRPDAVGLPITTITLYAGGKHMIHTHNLRMIDLCSKKTKQQRH